MAAPLAAGQTPPAAGPESPAPRIGLGATGRWGAVLSLALLLALATWAALVPIGGAVTTAGQAVVRGKPKLVQSLGGGIVAEIDAANGDRVAAGQVVMRLDPTLLTVTRDMAMGRLAEALARQARLRAEQIGLDAPRFAYPDLPFPRPDTALSEAGQREVFAARQAVQTGRREQLGERLKQFDNQIAGTEAAIRSLSEQIALTDRELATSNQLLERGLMRESQVLELQRSRAALEGQLAGNRAEAARLHNAARDAELEVVQAERQFQEEVANDLRTVTAEAEQLVLQLVNTLADLDRVTIRAPSEGIVHELAVTTVGGVVTPGQTILQIVPLDQGLDFEMRLDPRAIDQVRPGQPAQVLFPAFDQRATPRVAGRVDRISPGVVTDPQTGQSYYRLTVAVPPEEIARLGRVEILPGMPVEAFLELGERSALSFLVHPVAAQLNRIFREE